MSQPVSTEIRIQLNEPTGCYRPGQRVKGTIDWGDQQDRESLEIRLIWFTRGKGDRDFEVVELTAVDPLKDSRPAAFDFEAPRHPCSFSGKLVSLVWAIEVISFPDREAEIHELIISPTGEDLMMNYFGSVEEGEDDPT